MTQTTDYPFHPLANQYPLLPERELKELSESIQRSGQRLPVILWRGQVIDGRNRQIACRLADVPCRYEQYLGSEESLQEHIEALNEHRRMLPPDDLRKRRKARLVRIEEARKAGESLAAIAAAEGVSKTTVADDVRAVEAETGERLTTTVAAKDGRTMPSAIKGFDTVKPAQTQDWETKAKEIGAKISAVPAAPAVDGIGLPIPAKAIPRFVAGEAMKQAENALRLAQKMVGEIAAAQGGEHLRKQIATRTNKGETVHYSIGIDNALKELKFSAPYASVCPYCLETPKKSCKRCLGSGVVTKQAWTEAGEEAQAKALALRGTVERNGEVDGPKEDAAPPQKTKKAKPAAKAKPARKKAKAEAAAEPEAVAAE